MQQEETQEISGKQLEDVKVAFSGKVGPDRDGLTQSQAREALKGLGKNKNVLQISKFWSDLEKSDSDLLSKDEFVKLYSSKDCEVDRLMHWAFNKFDADNNGIIDFAELQNTLKIVYGEDFVDDDFVKDVIAFSDENGDGVLQTEEFIDMMMERYGSIPS